MAQDMLITPSLMCIGQLGGGDRVRDIREPAPTTVSKQEACVAAPVLVQVNHSGGDRAGQVVEPIPTVTAKHGYGVAAANLIQYHTEQTEHVRASGLRGPIQTIDASNRYGLTSAQLVEYYTGGRALSVEGPLHTVTSHDREAVVSAHIAKFYGGVIGADAKEPVPTITSVDHNALTAAHVVKFKGTNLGSSAADPVQTITASAGKNRSCGGGNFAVCKVQLCKIRPEDNGNLHHWPEIRALLNKHCGYQMANDDLLLLEIAGVLYYIADIGLRMLTPRELYNAMGFPADYEIDKDYTGKPYPKNEQVARCGNAVCPPLAAAVARANLPEWSKVSIDTMAQLEQAVAI